MIRREIGGVSLVLGMINFIKNRNFTKRMFMAVPLNSTQLEILNLFSHDQSEEDLKELKSLLISYLADKVTREADKAYDKAGYTAETFEKWKSEHFRKTA